MSGFLVAIYVLGLAMLVTFALDWRITRAFKSHEDREEKLHAGTQLVSDAAAATAREASRHIAEIQIEVTEQKINVANLGELLRVQEGRLAAVERRLLLATLAVPHPTIREGA